MDGGEIARILERPPQGGNASEATVVVLRRPVIMLAGAPTAQRGKRDRLVAHERVGLQAVAQRPEIAQRLARRARLAHGPRRAIALAQREWAAAGHAGNASRPVLPAG